MKPILLCLALTITSLLLAPLASFHAADTPAIRITDRAVIFKHTSTDPKDPANISGFNLGPSIAALPDGRVMAAWFSSPVSPTAASEKSSRCAVVMKGPRARFSMS